VCIMETFFWEIYANRFSPNGWGQARCGAQLSNVSCNPLLGCNYRVRNCALYIQLNRKRTANKAKGPEMDK